MLMMQYVATRMALKPSAKTDTRPATPATGPGAGFEKKAEVQAKSDEASAEGDKKKD
jgi:hypothetical protein